MGGRGRLRSVPLLWLRHLLKALGRLLGRYVRMWLPRRLQCMSLVSLL